MITDAIFHWHRPVPEDWQRTIARLAPRTDRASHLVLFWEAGSPDMPTQRWVLYEATPVGVLMQSEWGRFKLDAFHAKPVCRCAYHDAVIGVCARCHGMQSAGRQRIRDYLEATECFALPFWILQGSEGGHRIRYTEAERSWARLAGRPQDPPEPGSLPYAVLDQRVIRKIRAYDRTRLAFGSLGTAYAEEQAEAMRQFRAALADYTDTAVAQAFDALPVTRRSGLVDALPRSHTATRLTVDTAEARDAFVQGVS